MTLLILFWCCSNFFITYSLILIAQKKFNFVASVDTFTHPRKGMLSSFIYLAITFVLVCLFQKLIPDKYFQSSIWQSVLNTKTLIPIILLGLLPSSLHMLTTLLFYKKSKIEYNFEYIKSHPFNYCFLIIIIIIHATIEEIVFRRVPISIYSRQFINFSLYIPLVFFIFVHFLESNRKINYGRILDLTMGGIYFYIVAYNAGLLPAIITHSIINISRTLTDGNYNSGAIIGIYNHDINTTGLLHSIGFLINITILYFSGFQFIF